MSEGYAASDDRLPVRLGRRLMHSASTAGVAATQRWAWSNPFVLLGVAGAAAAGYVVHRRGGHHKLAASLDSGLVTAGTVLDPDPTDTASALHPVRKIRHSIIHRLTRGAAARRNAVSGE